MKEEINANAAIGGEIGILSGPLSDGWGWYLYGVARRGGTGEQEFPGGLGIDGKPVQTFPCGDLVAIVSPVLLDEMGTEAIRSRLRDASSAAGWLEEVVRSHELVVEAAQREWGVLPARFGCIYATARNLGAALEHSHDPLLAQLERLEGCDEWGVKLYADRPTLQRRVAAKSPMVLELQQELAAASPGRSYFLRRKLADVVAAATDQELSDLAQQGYDRLAGHAVGAHMSSRPRALSAPTSEVEILRAAFLVQQAGIGDFVEETHGFTEGQEGLRCEYSGPWPAYSFAALGEEALG